LELSLHALTLLPSSYTLDIYGIEAEQGYADEMKALAHDLGLDARVVFHGTIPMAGLPAIYMRHAFILNMASETIDKTMLEAMTCGCYPVTTLGNARAIGLEEAPSEETPEAIADFICRNIKKSFDVDALYRIVAERHSLIGLVEKMSEFIKKGA
jgi:glycosyltransferase involved in cell wall biosynthesis